MIVIAEDDDTYEFQEYEFDPPTAREVDSVRLKIEKILIMGWRHDLPDIIMLIDQKSAKGSELYIIAEFPVDEREAVLNDLKVNEETLTHITIKHYQGSSKRHVSVLPIAQLTSCLIFADEAKGLDILASDCVSIKNLLLLREIQMLHFCPHTDTSPAVECAMMQRCPVIVEVLDTTTQMSIQSSPTLLRLSDYLQSNLMISRVMAMVSEDRAVNSILDELLGVGGAGLELKPSELYVNPGEHISFMQLCKRAQGANEILWGYQVTPGTKEGNTYMNPRDKIEKKSWEDHFLITMAGPPKFPEFY